MNAGPSPLQVETTFVKVADYAAAILPSRPADLVATRQCERGINRRYCQ